MPIQNVGAEIIAAHKAGLEERRRREQAEQDAEDHKLNVQQRRLALDAAKIQQKLFERDVQKMTSGGATGQAVAAMTQPAAPEQDAPPIASSPGFQLPQNIQDLLQHIRSRPVSFMGNAYAPIPAGSQETGTPPALPDITIQLSGGQTLSLPGTNLEIEKAKQIEELLQGIQMAGLKAGTEEQAKAPFAFHPLGEAGGIIGAGTSSETRIPGVPKQNTPSLTETDITVDGKGPVRAVFVKNDDGSFRYLNPTTGQPIQGVIGTYERPREQKEPEPVPDPEDLLVTTSTGKEYVDAGGFTGKVANAIRTAAATKGIHAPDRATIDKIRSVDIARQNANYMLTLIESRLPKDAAGRLLKGPSNKLEALFQTDPVLATVGTFRIAAIQQIQGLSTGPGLRINQAEIQAAQENDIPRLGDTLDVARQRVQNLLKFLETSENTFLPKKVKDNRNSADLIQVQIPGQPPGRIPRSALPQFLKDNPGAKQVQ